MLRIHRQVYLLNEERNIDRECKSRWKSNEFREDGVQSCCRFVKKESGIAQNTTYAYAKFRVVSDEGESGIGEYQEGSDVIARVASIRIGKPG